MINEIEREEIYDFLEHVGVKGMHWGVRKRVTKSRTFKALNKNAAKRARITPLSNKQMAAVAAVGIGAAAASRGLFRYANTPTRAIGTTSFGLAGALVATDIMVIHKQRKLKDLKSGR